VVNVSELSAHSNVRLLGPMSHDEAVRHMVRFDAGLLPYRITPYTAGLAPMKLKEYLAAGLPVVSTSLSEVKRFAAEHGPVVTFADDAATFARAVRAALVPSEPAAIARRLEIARHYDWSQQMKTMIGALASALDADAAPARMAGARF
jgi:glycosyltransferase involved in cell wall biosynthesis